MKKIYLSLSVLFIASQISLAQLSLTKAFNEPVVGDIFNKQKYDTTTAIPKSTGAGMNWNFNTLTINTSTEVSTYTTTASTPSASIFPGASISEIIGMGGNYNHYKPTASTFEYQGVQFPGTPINFSNTAVYYVWPYSFGTTNTDNFSGTTTTGTVTTSFAGSIAGYGSGTGTVVMPGGLTLTNCLQLKNVLTFTLMQGSNVQTQIQTEYLYFHGSNKFPILSVQYQAQTSGTVTSNTCDVWVNKAVVAGINETQLSTNNFVVFPNPATNVVNVVLPNNEIATQLQVVDVTGKVVKQISDDNIINVADLAKGVYFVRITNKESILQKQIVLVD
jgi:hypothetical protein